MRTLLAASICGFAALTIGASVAMAADTQPYKAQAKAGEHWNMLTQYCTDCHNFEDWAGGVAFDTMSADGIPNNRETFEKVVAKLRGHMMPPPGKERPENAEITSFVSWLETYLDEVGADHKTPGHVVLHRMNRKEYANAVEDMLALKVDPASLLPRDDISNDFDNIANVLQVSPAFTEQYISAARTVAEEAVGNPDPLPAGTTYVPDSGTQQTHVEGLPLGTRGGMAVDHLFPVDGEYEINIANMAAALWVLNQEFENTVVVLLDGKQIYETTVGGEADIKAIDQDQDPAVDAINQRLKNIRFTTTSGIHKVGVTFKARTFAESDDRLRQYIPGGGQDRILRISQFEVRGPFESKGISSTPSRDRIFICRPQGAAQDDDCARKIIANLAEQAYRRKVTDADLKPLMAFFEKGNDQKDFDTGVRMALTGILASPQFLYRAEPTPANVQPGGVFALNSRELASRLSFFLWSSLPDEELLTLAEADKLTDRKVLEQQVKRMLADPRSKTLASNFAYQWFNLARLDEVEPDPGIFPYASGAGDQRANFKTELNMFVDYVFRNDLPVTELMTADYSFLNESLALHYGIKDVKGDRFRKVALKDHPERWGLLGKGGVLMASSYPNRTSPVLRGEWIMDRVLGTPPAAPPPNVVTDLKENPAGAKDILTVREMMADHASNPSCNSCHGILDPLGLALENFDAVGKWRARDRFSGKAIDATGVLPDGTEIDGPVDLRKALMVHPDQFVQTLTERLMTYAVGRTMEYEDMPTVRQIVRNVAKDDYSFSSLVMNIVESDQFMKQSVPQVADTGTKEAALHLKSDQ
jgi:hypothetical protein